MASIQLLVLDTTRKGGAGVYSDGIAARLAARGHRVTVICHEASPEVERTCEVALVPRIASEREYGLWRFAAYLQVRDYRKHLARLNVPPADVVIGSAQPMVKPWLDRRRDLPLIYIPHSLVAPIEVATYPYVSRLQRWASVRAYEDLERWCLRRAFATVRFTNLACDAFRNHYGPRVAERQTVLPLPIDMPPTASSRAPGKPLRLITVGRLVESKNVAFVLRRLALLQDRDWIYEIVGDGEERRSLEELAKSLGLSNRVVFHGHQASVDRFYQQADLFVFPSRLENSPIVLLEAMSHSLPTLSFRPDGRRFVSANHEIVTHHESGLLADDDDDFARWLARFLDAPESFNVLGPAARDVVQSRNQWSHHVDALERLLLDAATNKIKAPATASPVTSFSDA